MKSTKGVMLMSDALDEREVIRSLESYDKMVQILINNYTGQVWGELFWHGEHIVSTDKFETMEEVMFDAIEKLLHMEAPHTDH